MTFSKEFLNVLPRGGIGLSISYNNNDGKISLLRRKCHFRASCRAVVDNELSRRLSRSLRWHGGVTGGWKTKFSRDGKKFWQSLAASDPIVPNIMDYEDEDDSDDEETEEEARYRNWTERGWAPWEELYTPEAKFAVDSLADGDGDGNPVPVESFEKLNPKVGYDQMIKELQEAARKEEEEEEKIKKGIKFEDTFWNRPLVFTLTPPRDWPPPGWHVDSKELAYIREALSQENIRIDTDEINEETVEDAKIGDFPHWELFMKQYREWVAANKDRLEQEALEMDDEYYPGRRRTGAEYGDGMYELPFLYPGQHYWGIVTAIHLYEGAFVYYGGVHDGWVPIMDNDWYEIRKHIKVGMYVQVEVVAKRDPYRFRFPVEMRFVDPNIDDLIFRRFEYPPIFGRKGDENLDDVARESGRPFYPKPRPEIDPDDEDDPDDVPVHPFVARAWHVHEAEQMTLEDEDGELSDPGEDWAVEEEDPDPEWESEPGLLNESVPGWEHIDDKHMNLEAARAEREALKVLAQEAEAKGEEFVPPESRFDKRVRELNDMHLRRLDEEKEALVRDQASRLQAGLPLEEPGRYADKSFWGKNPYDPRQPQWRSDYWGDPAKIKEELRKEREPRVRNVEETVGEEEDEDDLLDVIAGEATMLGEEGLELGEEGIELDEEGFLKQVDSPNKESRVTYKGKEDRGAVNGTATKRVDGMQDVIDVDESDWNFLEDDDDDGENESKGGTTET